MACVSGCSTDSELIVPGDSVNITVEHEVGTTDCDEAGWGRDRCGG